MMNPRTSRKPGPRRRLDWAEVYRLYVDEGLAAHEVAARVGCKKGCVVATAAAHAKETRDEAVMQRLRQVSAQRRAGRAAPAAKVTASIDGSLAFRLRTEQGLTLDGIADRLGCSVSSVTKVLNAHVRGLPDPAAAEAALRAAARDAHARGRITAGERARASAAAAPKPQRRTRPVLPTFDPLAASAWDLVHGRGLDARRAALRLGVGFHELMELLARHKRDLDQAWMVAAIAAPPARDPAEELEAA